MVEVYRKVARYYFECGNYQEARERLTYYIGFFAQPPAPSATNEEDDDLAGLTSSNNQNNNDRDLGNPALYYLPKVDDEKTLQVL